MKNNKEIKLIYRVIDDKFFVINKPVNWTLKKKEIIEKVKSSKCLNEVKGKEDKNKNKDEIDENIKYMDALKNLSNTEKNTYLFTNSSPYFYNDFNFNLNKNNIKPKDKEDESYYKRTSHNEFIEKYYLESILKCETKTDIYFPYKLPLYMSGLVICCRDYFIYKKFLEMIHENKLIRKYRCLMNDPFVFINNKQNYYKREEYATKNFKSLINECNQSKKVNKISNEEINNNSHLSEISSLKAQKEISEMFPFYNFFDNNFYSSSYWYNITDLKIEKLNEKINFLLESDKRKKSTLPKTKRKRYYGDIEKNNYYFIDSYLKKSQPIKSLTSIFNYMFNNITSEFLYLTSQENFIKQFEEQGNLENSCSYYNSIPKKSKKEFILDDKIYNLNLKNLYSSKKKILYPLSLFFNEGNFFFLDKEIDKNSLKFSMIYKIKNYKDYLEKNIFLNKEKSMMNNYLEDFANVFLIEFVLLDNPKPDLIRFFFSEIKTPIINDNIFDRNKFKKDIINELILKKENNNSYVNLNIFRDTNGDDSHIYSNEIIQNYNKKYNEHLLNKYKSNTDTFTIPDDNSLNNVNKETKLNLNNYFINETINPVDDSDYHTYGTKKRFPKNDNLFLELYQLQFCDPLNNDFIKIENSLSTSWM